MIRKLLLSSFVIATLFCFIGCETWYVSAARAAKKRESQTGPVMGELEQAAGIDDPLGRQQNNIEDTADNMGNKADKFGEKLENVADDM